MANRNLLTRSKGWDQDLVPRDILQSLEDLGIMVVKVTYGEAWALCPGHESMLGRRNNKPDKWSINMETGVHSCFSCGFSGSFTTLVREVLGYDRDAAVAWVRSHGGVRRIQRDVGVSAYRFERDSRVRAWNEARLALFADPPQSALAERRISARSVEHYGILWSDGEDPCWILPIRGEDGEFWGYQEKSENGWVSNKPYGVVKSDTLFGIEVFDSPFVVVVESPLDCAVLHTNGIHGAVSTFGAKISQVQMDLLLSLGVPIYFALDNDDAGIKSSLAIRDKYLKSGYPIKFLNYSHMPDKKDVGTAGVTKTDMETAFLTARNMVRYRP